MQEYSFFSPNTFQNLINRRKLDVKVGEHMDHCAADNWKSKFASSKYKYVLIGIEEDLGVIANGGYPGTKNTWLPSLKCLLNTQRNTYNNLDNTLVFGSLQFREGTTVQEIDQVVSDLIEFATENSKTPIIVGGGHNNAYGIIKGVSKALKNTINVINIDAHTDFRDLENRHSGNGFSFAYREKYLKKYAVLGLDTLYTPDYIYKEFLTNSDLLFINKEDIDSGKYSLSKALEICKEHTLFLDPIGLEIDYALIYFVFAFV
jgi:formiminoglutamase